MEDDLKFPQKVRYEYESDEERPLIFAHGVWGGLNPHGQIEMNLYTESDRLPESSEREILPDGSVGPEVALMDPEVKTIVRTIHARVVIDHRTARALLEWLQEKVENLEMEDEHAHFLLDPDAGPEQ
jgi:hypothetical protein